MFIYRLFLNFAAFPLGLLLMIRCLKGTEDWTDFWQRFGKPVAMKRPEQKWLWVHAASNGELQSAKPVLDALAARYSQTSLLITCNSLSGRLWAKELGYHAVLSPLDLRWAQRRFMSAYPIAAHVTFEAELWPNRIAILAAAGIPIAALGARMSAHGQNLWRRFPRLSAKLLNALAYLQPQDADSDQRQQVRRPGRTQLPRWHPVSSVPVALTIYCRISGKLHRQPTKRHFIFMTFRS